LQQVETLCLTDNKRCLSFKSRRLNPITRCLLFNPSHHPFKLKGIQVNATGMFSIQSHLLFILYCLFIIPSFIILVLLMNYIMPLLILVMPPGNSSKQIILPSNKFTPCILTFTWHKSGNTLTKRVVTPLQSPGYTLQWRGNTVTKAWLHSAKPWLHSAKPWLHSAKPWLHFAETRLHFAETELHSANALLPHAKTWLVKTLQNLNQKCENSFRNP
jgi:hypothetical protein